MQLPSDVLEQMSLQPENPQETPKRGRLTLNKSEITEQQINSVDGRIWVKCVTELQPWAEGKPLKFWEDYLITVQEAILLDARRFAVILKPLNTLEK